MAHIVSGVSLPDSPGSKSSFPWKLALALYGVSFLPNLLSINALFWDDWTWFNHQTGKLLKANYTGSGNAPWRTWIEIYVFQSSLPVFRIVSLIGYFAVGYFLFHILKRSKFFNAHQLVAITLLFLVIPVNSARISIANSKYGVDLFFFFLAWYIYETKSHKLSKFFAFAFFFLSYSTLPFPTFTLLPILYHVVLKYPKNIREYIREFANTIPLILLPICYLALRQIYWPPMGGLVDMYTPQLSGLARSLIFVLICSIPLALLLASTKYDGIVKPNLLVAAGSFSVSIAAVPYMVGGRLVDISDWLIAFIPNFSDWDSRNQLTLPLGIALIIVGFITMDKVEKLRWNTYPVLTTALAVFIVLNVTFAQEYFLDSRKQDAVLDAMASNPELKSVRSIYIDDQAVRFNARGRLIRSYEWDGMLDKALGSKSVKVSYLQYPDCNAFKPDAILHISSPNGRLESTLRGKVVIDLRVEKIDPCSD
ncbi:MAG: hypothetical protein EBY23_08955 [Actinobacteria bacterium]|nr:hypothetical protein [Actinomycetota bacterium]